MKNLGLLLGGAILITLLVFGVYSENKESFGGVNIANEYKYWSSDGMATGTKIIIQSGSSALGSVTINEASAHAITLWDSASTTEASPTVIATPKASIAEGTYTYDVSVYEGLMVQTAAGFAGDLTISYR